MSESNAELDELLDDILDRIRQGEEPNIDALCAEHGDLQEELRRLLPSLLLIEGVKPDSQPRSIQTESPNPPEEIGGYRILGEIGRGGMGVVYEAEQLSLGRRVALKMLPQSIARSESAVRRFRREARAAARLHHTNIAPVFEVGQSGDTLFFTMQLIHGVTLDAVLKHLSRLRRECETDDSMADDAGHAVEDRRGRDELSLRVASFLVKGRFPAKHFADVTVSEATDRTECTERAADISTSIENPLTEKAISSGSDRFDHHYWRSVARIGLQVAEALAYSHAHGIVHRDIKPGNLILDECGVAWVTDFGLALTEGSDITETGDIIGTLRYLPPERFRGQCDESSDVYSLGITMYELLTLRPAFEASNRLQLIESICNSEPTPPRKCNPRIPRDLETIVLKASDREPTSRYASSEALAEDFRCFLSDKPITGRRANLLEQSLRWARRNRQLAAATTAIALLLVLVAIGSSGALVREAMFRRETELSNERLQRRLYAYQIQRANAAYQDDNLTVLRKCLDECPVELRGWEWHRCNWLAKPKQVLNIKGYERPLFTPDGRLLICSGDRGGADSDSVAVWDAHSGRLVDTEMTGRTNVTSLSLSPDGKWLATGFQNGTIKLWDFDLRTELWSQPSHTDKIDGIGFSPDGSRFASVSWDQTLKVYEAVTGRILLSIGPVGYRLRGVEYSPDGASLATACFQAGTTACAKVWDAESAELIHELAGHLDATGSVTFSPDGRRILTGSHDGTIKLWDSQSGDELRTHVGHRGGVQAVVFSPDGKRFASGSLDRTIRLWDSETGRELTRHRTGGPVAWLSYSPDGERIGSFGGDRIKVWGAEGPVDVPVLRHQAPVMDCAFSPDGSRIASCGLDGTIKIWNLASTKLLHALQGHEGEVRALSWHPRGGWIASGSSDQTVRLWDVETGESLATIPIPGHRVFRIDFSPDGRFMACGSDFGAVWIYEVSSRNLVRHLTSGSNVNSVAWSSDGRFLATGQGRDMVTIWDWRSGQRVSELEVGEFGLEFASDGSRLIGGSASGTVRIGELSGEKPNTIRFGRHQGPVKAIAVSPDGGRLISAGHYDTTIRVWDSFSQEELLTLRGRQTGIQSVSFSPDGATIASGSSDGTINLYESRDSSVALAERRIADRAARLANRLYEREQFSDAVLAKLKSDPKLDPAVRAAAIDLVAHRRDPAFSLFSEGWAVVISPDEDTETLELARRKLELACAVVPDSPGFRTGLGVALYRLGRFDEAQRLLADARDTAIVRTPIRYIRNVPNSCKATYPVSVAFLAMTLKQLGRDEEAKSELARLQETLKNPFWLYYADAERASIEAERLIGSE